MIMKIFRLCKKYLINHKWRLILYIIINLSVGCISILTPYLTGNFIDNLVAGKGIESVYSFCIVLASISIGKLLLGYYTSMVYVKMQTTMGYEFNREVIFHIQKLSLSYINKKDTAYLNQIVNNDANSLIIFCITVIQNFILNSVYLIVPLFIIFRINALISSLLLVFSVVYLVLFIAFKKPLYNISMKYKESQGKFFSKLYEQLQFIRFIKIHGVEDEFHERLDNSFGGLLSNAQKNQKMSYIYSSLDGIVALLVQITLYLAGGIQIINGNFTIGMFTIFFSYFNMILGSIRYFFMFGKSYQDTLVSYDRLVNIVDEKEESDDDPIDKRECHDIDLINIKNLCFAHDDKVIFQNASFSFEKGKLYGIVGENGSGKSTLINLLLGLYINERQGIIEYNKCAVENIDMKLMRKNEIGISEQEPVLINDTIKYNLLMGVDFDLDANSKLLKDYLHILDFDRYIMTLSDGFDMPINEKNTNLSGGEKQKLSILRVLLKNPRIMIFDEPTSALDAKSSDQFSQYLNSIKQDKIIILVTHNKTIMENCDVIYSLA